MNNLEAEVPPPAAALDSCEDSRDRLRARRRAHMEEETAYTLALWRVKEGREAEFVEAWKGFPIIS